MSKNDTVRRVYEETHHSGGRNIRLRCPFCERRGHRGAKANLSLESTTGLWYCHRCGEGGGLKGFSGGEQLPEPMTTLELPPGTPLTEATWRDPLLSHATAYLESRGVRPFTARLWEMRACFDGPFAGRVVIPIYDNERLEGYVGRDWTGKNPLKYRYAKGMQRARLLGGCDEDGIPYHERVLVVEGMLDVVHLTEQDNKQAGLSGCFSVAVLGTPTEKQLERLAALPRPVVFVLDGDAWRKAEACAIQLRLMGQSAGWVKLPPGKDPDEVDYDWLVAEAQRSILPPEV